MLKYIYREKKQAFYLQTKPEMFTNYNVSNIYLIFSEQKFHNIFNIPITTFTTVVVESNNNAV